MLIFNNFRKAGQDMRDSIVTGLIAGILGGLVYLVPAWGLWLAGIAKTTPLHISAHVFLPPGAATGTIPALTFGFIVHLIVSALLGIIAVGMLRLTGADYLWAKGLAFGGTVYLLVYGLIAQAFIPAAVLHPDLVTSAVFLFGHLVYGLIAVLFAGYYIQAEERA